MCALCPDYIDTCDECPPSFVRADGQAVQPSWYLTLGKEKWCEHLTAEYGTDNPSLGFHFSRDHEDDCPCLAEGWWSEPPSAVALGLRNSED